MKMEEQTRKNNLCVGLYGHIEREREREREREGDLCGTGSETRIRIDDCSGGGLLHHQCLSEKLFDSSATRLVLFTG